MEAQQPGPQVTAHSFSTLGLATSNSLLPAPPGTLEAKGHLLGNLYQLARAQSSIFVAATVADSTNFQAKCRETERRALQSKQYNLTFRRISLKLQTYPGGHLLLVDKQTGKNPVLLGRRRKRSLQFRSPLSGFMLNKATNYGTSGQANKQITIGGGGSSGSSSIKPNGTLTAQLSNLTNGTTSGNLAFTLNRPVKATASAYIWSNPLSRVLARNNSNNKISNKNISWQFGRGQAAASSTAAGQATGIGTATGGGAAKPAAAAVPRPGASAPAKPATGPAAAAVPSKPAAPAAAPKPPTSG